MGTTFGFFFDGRQSEAVKSKSLDSLVLEICLGMAELTEH